MSTSSYQVENIKCGGCAGSIRKALRQIDGVEDVEVEPERQEVRVHYRDPACETAQEQTVLDKLAQLGYPLAGSVSGLASSKAKAKSFVSCAIGKMSEKS